MRPEQKVCIVRAERSPCPPTKLYLAQMSIQVRNVNKVIEKAPTQFRVFMGLETSAIKHHSFCEPAAENIPKVILPRWQRVKNCVAAIALVILNGIAIWSFGYLYSVSFGLGMVFRNEVKKRITDAYSEFSLKWIVPGSILFHWLAWPGTITMEAIFLGLDFGSRFCRAARGELEEVPGTTTILFFKV